MAAMLISTVSATSPISNSMVTLSAVSPPPISPLLIAKDEEQSSVGAAAVTLLQNGGADFISSSLQLHKSPQGPLRTLSPPLPAASSHREGGSVFADGGVSGGSSPLAVVGGGHPREGQAASLLGNKYLLLEELEGSSLHRCLHIRTRQEFVCKVGEFLQFCQFSLVRIRTRAYLFFVYGAEIFFCGSRHTFSRYRNVDFNIIKYIYSL